MPNWKAEPLNLRNSPFSLPEILCLWANEPPYLAGHNIKHLASQDSRG
jgi:hypothetical protein